MAVLDDASVVRSVLQGEHDRFGVLVERYFPAVISVARARVVNHADAEDVAQETFLAAYRSLNQLRELEKFPAWLLTICRNECSRARSRHRRDSTVHAAALAESERVTLSESETRERREFITKFVNELDNDAREIVQLYYFGGFSHREIASMLEISEPAARKRLERARQTLSENVIAALSPTDTDRSTLKSRTKTITALALGSGATWTAATTNAASASVILWSTKSFVSAALAAAVAIALGAGVYFSENSSPTPLPATGLESLGLGANAQGPPPVIAPAEPVNPVQLAAAIAGDATGPEPSTETTSAANTPAVSGVVIDHNGDPVAGATVRAVTINNEERTREIETVSAEDGSFSFAELEPAERMHVVAKKDGMVRIPGPSDVVRKPFMPPLTNARAMLYPSATISGRVLGARGLPIVDREVTVRFHHPDGALITEAAMTDAGGYFTVTGLMPGTHSVTVIPEDQVRAALEDLQIELTPGETKSGIEITYPGDDFIVAGRVVNERGQPVRRATVQLLSVDGPNPADDYTDDDGRFRLLRIPKGTFSVAVWGDGYNNLRANATSGDTEIVYTLTRAVRGILQGRVVDARTGDPIPKFDVQLLHYTSSELGESQSGLFQSVENADGAFTLTEVPSRDVTVMVRSTGMKWRYEHVDFRNGSVAPVTVRLEPSKQAVGRVFSRNGTPVAGAFLLFGLYPRGIMGTRPSALKEDWLERNAMARSDAEGKFAIDSLIPDLKLITAYHLTQGAGTIRVTEETVDKEELSIALQRGGTARGRILVGGVPKANARLRIVDIGEFGEALGFSTSDENGEYMLNELPSKTLTVSVQLEPPSRSAWPLSGRTIENEVTIEDEKTTVHDFDFLPTVATVRGTITYEGKPATGGQVYLSMETRNGPERNSTSVNANGTYEFSDVPEGEASLVFIAGIEDENRSGASVNAFTIEPGAEHTINAELGKGRTLSGSVTNLRPEETFVMVTAFAGELEESGARGADAFYLRRGYAKLRPDGTFQIRLEPGAYTISIGTSVLNSRNKVVGEGRNEKLFVQIPSDRDVDIGAIRMP